MWTKLKIDLDDEIVGIQLKCNSTNIQIFNWYNPPNQRELNTNLLSWIASRYKNYLLMGDLNIHTNLCKKNDSLVEALIEFIHANEAVILNEPGQPTSIWRSRASSNRGALESNNILDLFIGTELFYDNLLSYKVLAHRKVDLYQKEHYHVPVVCEFSLTKKLISNQSKNQAYNFEKANWDCFKESLNEAIPDIVEENENILASKIEDCLVKAAKKAVPLIKKSKRQENFPEYIVNLKRIKNYWQRRYNKSKDERSRDNLYALKDAVKNELFKYESEKIKRFMKKLGPKPLTTKPLWKLVNR